MDKTDFWCVFSPYGEPLAVGKSKGQAIYFFQCIEDEENEGSSYEWYIYESQDYYVRQVEIREVENES